MLSTTLNWKISQINFTVLTFSSLVLLDRRNNNFLQVKNYNFPLLSYIVNKPRLQQLILWSPEEITLLSATQHWRGDLK